MDTVLPLPLGLEMTELAGDGIGDLGDELLGDRRRTLTQFLFFSGVLKHLKHWRQEAGRQDLL